MLCFIVGRDADDTRMAALDALTRQLGLQPVMSPDLAALQASRPFQDAGRALVLVLSGEPSSVEAVLQLATELGAGQGFVVLLADTVSPDDYKRLVRTRGGDWISWRNLASELTEFVRTIAQSDHADRGARIVTWLPSKGGVGNTTLMAEVAIHLTGRRRRNAGRIALLDLNLQGGTLADALDVEPRLNLQELVDRPERLDEQLVDVFTSRYSAKLDVFASPIRRSNVSPLSPAVIFAFLDAVAARYEAVLVDIPDDWAPWTDNLVRGSDAVVVTGGSTVPALKQLSACNAHLADLAIGADRLAVAINMCEASLLGRIVRQAEIGRLLAGRRSFFVRRDSATVMAAANAGRPISDVSPHSRVGRDIRLLAEWVAATLDRTPTVPGHGLPEMARP